MKGNQKQEQITTAITWHAQDAWSLENDFLRIVVVPKMGAKIVSLYDKKNHVEWLADSGERPFAPVNYGALFTDQDMSGWDEMFPTIVACQYPTQDFGAPPLLPDHGELWTLPWKRLTKETSSLNFLAEGRVLPYHFSRNIEITDSRTIKLTYKATNLSRHSLFALWAAHPQFAVGPQARIELPSATHQVINVLPESYGWGPVGADLNWPTADIEGYGIKQLDKVGPSNRHQARKFYANPPDQVNWVKIIKEPSNQWLSIHWNTEEIPFFGCWVDEGFYSTTSVVTPEPSTGFYDDLSVAFNNQLVMEIPPQQSTTWNLSVRFGDQSDLDQAAI